MTTPLEEDTDIYIECYAVDENNKIIPSEGETSVKKLEDLLFKDMKLDFGENIALQATVGVSLMVIVYVMADYVFKVMPKNAINKQINGV